MTLREIDEFDREAEREARALRSQREFNSKPRAERERRNTDRIVRLDDGSIGIVINGKVKHLK